MKKTLNPPIKRMAKARATERVVSFNPPSEGYWIIPSEKGDILLANTLLPTMTQDQVAKYETKEGFHSMSMPEHFELFDALYQLRGKGGDVEKTRQFIQHSMRDFYPNTQTRIIYTPKGNDKIVHGYGTSSAIEKRAEIVGANGKVLDVLTKRASMALTDKTPEQVAELMHYINRTPTYVCRLNQKPASVDDERVARLGAGFDGAGLGCFRSPQDEYPALGVHFCAKRRKKFQEANNEIL